MSLLRSEGHTDPHHYPIWKVWDEAKIARNRYNRNMRATTMAMYSAANAAGAQDLKAGSEALKTFLESFDNGEEY